MGGIIRFREYSPSPALRAFVECFWVAKSTGDVVRPSREILLPDGTAQLLLSAGNAYQRFDAPDAARGARIGGSHLVGLRTHGVFVEQQGAEELFAIRFRAGGLAPLIGIPADETVHRSIPLDVLLGAAGRDLEARIFDARTTRERIAIAEHALLRMLSARGDRLPMSRAVQRAVSRIYAARGGIRVAELGAELGLSYRALDRAFRRYVGIAPKRLSRIVRFNYALTLLHGASDARHSRIALDAGYADQAHMIRDFRAFTHSSPTDFLARRYRIVEMSQPALRRRLSDSFNTHR